MGTGTGLGVKGRCATGLEQEYIIPDRTMKMKIIRKRFDLIRLQRYSISRFYNGSEAGLV